MRILGLDIGTKRIGVAISDPLGITAQGLSNIEVDAPDKIIPIIGEIATKKEVREIVVGLPLNMDGSTGEEAKKVSLFAEELGKKLGIPVKLWDERLTTFEAERVMLEADASRNKRKRKIDKLAAQIILQSYLNALKT